MGVVGVCRCTAQSSSGGGGGGLRRPAARGGWSSEPPNTTTSVFERPDDSTRSICRCRCAYTRGGVGVGATAGCPTVQRASNDAAQARCPSANALAQSQEPMNRPTTNCSWARSTVATALRARSGGLRWPQSRCLCSNVRGQARRPRPGGTCHVTSCPGVYRRLNRQHVLNWLYLVYMQ